MKRETTLRATWSFAAGLAGLACAPAKCAC